MVLQPRALLLGSPGLGSSDFARHYFRNHGCFLFLGVLRWFTSPGSLRHPMDSDDGNECSHSLGFPIRISPDHSLLAAPRSFSQLTASFFACLRQGIHTHALSSLTIKSTSHTCRRCYFFRAYSEPSAFSLQPSAKTLRRLAVGILTDRRTADHKRLFNLCLVCPSIFSCQRSKKAVSFQLSAFS